MFERLRYNYGSKSIRFKLLLYNIVIAVLIVVCLSVPFIISFQNNMENTLNSSALQLIKQLKNNVEWYFQAIEMSTENLNSSHSMMAFLDGQYADDSEKQTIINQIKDDFYHYTITHTDIVGMLLVNQDGEIISNDMLPISEESMVNEDWYRKAINDAERIYLHAKPIGRNIKSIYNYYSSDNIVSFSKAVKDENGVPKGVLCIDLKLSTIGSIFSDVSFAKSGFFYLTDQNNQTIYSPVNDVVYRINPRWFNAYDNRFVKTIKSNTYQIIYEYSGYLDCNVVAVFSLSENMKIVNTMQTTTIIAAVVMIILSTIFTFWYTSNFKNRVDHLKDLMRQAEEGCLDVRFTPKYEDEIGELGARFNTMIDSLNALITVVENNQKKLRESELRTFQMQIKPHFLYNTLDTINWMAQEYQADDISKLVLDITTFFRLSLNKGREIITIGEELKQVESYLSIQKVRYENKFEYKITCADDLEKYKVIKLILQPIIENSIYHGIKLKEGYGCISIKAERIGDAIQFTIKDDGVGIDADTVRQINERLNNSVLTETDTDTVGIGIYNVNERIKLSYGDRFGVYIESSLGEGTWVTITHPCIE